MHVRQVNKQSERYLALKESIRANKQLHPIIRNAATGKLISGAHREAACKELGIEPWYRDLEATRLEALRIAISENADRVPAKPVEYAQALADLAEDFESLADLAAFVKQSKTWIRQQMSLTDLTDKAANLVNTGAIPVKSGMELAKLPKKTQDALISSAVNLSGRDFAELIRRTKRDLMQDQNRRKLSKSLSELRPALRPFSEILKRWERASGPEKEVLDWVLKMDPETLEKRKKL